MIEPVQIFPDALLDDGALYQAIGLSRAALARGRRDGSLRYTHQGKRVLYKWAWILAWLDITSVNNSSAAGKAGVR